VLLAETLRSSTLKLALLAIGLFGSVMFALIGYVYWSTASYVVVAELMLGFAWRDLR
jgi:hypothetical protein